jgi:hypothetical protein
VALGKERQVELFVPIARFQSGTSDVFHSKLNA